MKEQSLAVHMCEPKRRFGERDEVGVRLGLQCYQRFYQTTQGSARTRDFDDFAGSAYYRAFVKFGRYCVSIRAINIPRFTDWLLRNNKKIDHWCRDSVYTQYLTEHVRQEAATDALTRSLEQSIEWSERTGNPDRDYLRYGNANAICADINNGRVTAWTLYHCDSGLEFLAALNSEQIAMIWPMIDADFWQRRFQQYPSDAEYCRHILTKAGW
jgi:hypothetical protein